MFRFLCVAWALVFTAATAEAMVVRDEAPAHEIAHLNHSFPIVADPKVQHPPLTPTTVTLFEWMNFTGEGAVNFNFTTPMSSPDQHSVTSKWSKIVLNLRCLCTPGRQFDRTTLFALNDHIVFIGTTSEPTGNLGPHWVTQADVTQYSAMLGRVGNQSGWIELISYVTPVYNGVLSCKSSLDFYPVQLPAYKQPRVPDIAVTMGYQESVMAANVTLPSSLSEVYLSLFLQGQHDDEFFWSCLPTNLSNIIGTCGMGSLRMAQVSIDGQLAGLVPAFPYIFTGGIDPNLWIPIPAARTLNLVPLKIDLSCFMGQLGDGNTHVVEVKMEPTYNPWWNLAGTIFAFVDAEVQSTTLIKNTLPIAFANATQTVTQNVVAPNNTVSGWGNVSYQLEGYCSAVVKRASGSTTITAKTSLSFYNQQWNNASGKFTTPGSYAFSTTLSGTSFNVTLSSASPSSGNLSSTMSLSFPFKVVQVTLPYPQNYSLVSQLTQVDQAFEARHADSTPYNPADTPYHSVVTDHVVSQDVMLFDAKQNFVVGSKNQSSRQHFVFKDSRGNCWDKTVTAANHTILGDMASCSSLTWDANPFLRVTGGIGLIDTSGSQNVLVDPATAKSSYETHPRSHGRKEQKHPTSRFWWAGKKKQ